MKETTHLKVHYLSLPVRQSKTGWDKQLQGKQKEKSRQKGGKAFWERECVLHFLNPLSMVFILFFFGYRNHLFYP